jgi:hypothetical protein
MVEEAAHPLFDDSAAVLEEVAGALESDDAERAQNAYRTPTLRHARSTPG